MPVIESRSRYSFIRHEYSCHDAGAVPAATIPLRAGVDRSGETNSSEDGWSLSLDGAISALAGTSVMRTEIEKIQQAMLIKPAVAENPTRYPECAGLAIVRIPGGQFHCNGCGRPFYASGKAPDFGRPANRPVCITVSKVTVGPPAEPALSEG